MGRSEVSRHEVEVYRVLVESRDSWLSSREVAEKAQVSARTARSHALKLVRLGILEQVDAFPGYRYRLTDQSRLSQDAEGHRSRLRLTAEALGVELELM